MICDEIVDVGTMDGAIERVVQALTSSGVVAATANRRAFRVVQEPFDLFPVLRRSLCARASLLPSQPGAHRQPGALLERALLLINSACH